MSEQDEMDALNIEYKKYIDRMRSEWRQRPENKSHSKDVYEVMGERDREHVHAIMNRWPRYITPFAEAWWKERGYKVSWPDDDSEPMKVRKMVQA